MDGVICVYKTAGPTSHDVVADIRRIFGQKRVGHAGTLDPMATGVLVVCLGKATRIVEYLVGAPKQYRAKMLLGVETNTQDSTGEVTKEADASYITREAVERVIRDFIGDIEQIPPMVSAIKHEGKPLYKLARQGITIERKPRKVTIYSLEINSFASGNRPEVEITIDCSSGTYIRTLCADIGERLGCGGTMSMLERTKVGAFTLDKAHSISEIHEYKDRNVLDELIVDMNSTLDFMPFVRIENDCIGKVMSGSAVRVNEHVKDDDIVRMIASDGKLAGIGIISSSDEGFIVKPKKVLISTED